jgi:GTP pyrophosphokinase
MKEFGNIFANLHYPLTEHDHSLLEKAYLFAKKAHEGQKRYSGEEYINHVVRSVENLAKFGVDVETLVAGFLHDTIEDCGVTKEEIAKEFSENIAFLVTGVSKLGNIKYQGHKRYADNIRHLFIATAHDIRVILIKLADRLDNMRTLEYVPRDKQKRIALETLDIYAPIANRLGMGVVQHELQDLAFKFSQPKEYERVQVLIKERGKERERYIKKVYQSLAKELVKQGMHDVKVSYRIKDSFGIYKKLLKTEMDIGKIYDVYALRIIVPKIEDCYRALGITHNMWKPLPGRFKDYIANPKINGYQSLHTTVFTGDGGIAEIQIRTPEMHAEAEYGISSHLIYKEVGVTKKTGKILERLDWLTRIRDLHKEHKTEKPEDFLTNLKIDFFDKRIFVFTPKGDVLELPEGSTALDFAYAVHSEIGNHASGVRVNGKFVSLNTPLSNRDIVHVETREGSRPTRKWLEYVKTNFARKYIRAYLKSGKSN